MKMRFLLRLLLLALLSAVPARAEDAQTAPPAAYDGATFLLPAGSGITARWVLPPVRVGHSDPLFALDGAGNPIFAKNDDDDTSRLVNPVKNYAVRLERRVSAILRLPNGGLLFAAGDTLAFPVAAETRLDKDNLPRVALQPLVRLPVARVEAATSGPGGIFVAGPDPKSGRHEIFRLDRIKGAGPAGLVLVYETKAPVTALASGQGALYVATDTEVLRVPDSGPAETIFAGAEITQVAALKTGLAISTGRELIFAGPTGTLSLMRSPGHSIAVLGDTLYVFFHQTTGVLALDHLDNLARVDLNLRPMAEGEGSPALALDSGRLFAVGEKAGDPRRYGDGFDRESVGKIGAEITLRATDPTDRSTHSVAFSWIGPFGWHLASQLTSATPDAEGLVHLTATLGGPTRHGFSPPTWVHRFQFSDELGLKYPGDYRLKIAVDGIAAGEVSLRLTGKIPTDAAIISDDIPELKRQLSHGLDLRKGKGRDLLGTALVLGSTEAVKLLLDKGVDANALNDRGQPPLAQLLDLLSPPDWRAKADLLIRHHARVNVAADKNGKPLVFEVANWDADKTIYLLEHGASITTPPKSYTSLISLASERSRMCRPELIRLLMKRGVKLDAVLDSGIGKIQHMTPLGFAIWSHEPDCAETLLSLGAGMTRVYGDHSALFLALQGFSSPDRPATEASRRIVAMLRAKGAKLTADEVYLMFRGTAPGLFTLPELAAALDRETPTEYRAYLGLQAALESADPAVRALGLRRAAGLVRSLTASASDRYRLSDALDICADALPALEEGYGTLSLSAAPDPTRPALGAKTAPRLGGGAYVLSVPPGTPAARAGLIPGDIVTAVDGAPLEDHDFAATIEAAPGPEVTLSLMRDDPSRLPALTIGCGVVARTLGETGPVAANLLHWLAENPDAPEAAAIARLPTE